MREHKIEKNIKETIDSYVESACKYGELIKSENYKYANKKFAVNQKAFKKLLILGNPGCKALINLLDHKNSYVRMSASIHLLSARTIESLVVLKEIICDAGFQGFNARIVLEDFKKVISHYFPLFRELLTSFRKPYQTGGIILLFC